MEDVSKKTDLQKAIDALEKAGFHVDRAYEENNLDAGVACANYTLSYDHTGAIILRATPNAPANQESCPV
jgi:hypothetical protein